MASSNINERDSRRVEFNVLPDGPWTCSESKSGFLYLWPDEIPESCLVEITKAAERISELEDIVSNYKQKFNTASGEASVLRAQLNKTQIGYNVVHAKMQYENDALKKKMEEIQSQKEHLVVQAESLQEKLSESKVKRKQLRKLQRENDASKKKIEEIANQKVLLAAEVQSLQEQLGKSKLKKKQLKERLRSEVKDRVQREQVAEASSLRKALKRCRKQSSSSRISQSHLALTSLEPSTAHPPIAKDAITSLSAQALTVYRKIQQREAKGKQPKSDPFKCSLCDYGTADVWEFLQHLRQWELL